MRLCFEFVFIAATQERVDEKVFDLGPLGFVEYTYGNLLRAWAREVGEEEPREVFYIDSQYDGVGPLHAWRVDTDKDVEAGNWDYEFTRATIMGGTV